MRKKQTPGLFCMANDSGRCVYWNEKRQKWRGAVFDVLERGKNDRPKQLVTKYFDTKEEAIEARKKLQEDTDERYWATVTRWAKENPLTRDLPLGPKDASEAEGGVVYWRPNRWEKHQPHRMVRVSAGKQGFVWRRACNLCETVHDPFIKEVHYCQGHMPKEYRCPHGTPPFSGPKVKCTMCNPKSATYSIKCSHCQDTVLDSKRYLSNGGNGFCPSCEQTLQKEAAETGTDAPEKGQRWEEVVVEKLKNVVTIPYEMHDDFKNVLGSRTTKKRKTRSGDNGPECDTTTHRRPDVLYILRCPLTSRIVTVIFFENDEDSHDRRTAECELGRIDDLYESVTKLAQTEGGRGVCHPDSIAPLVHVLRMNCNGCDAKPSVSLDKRIALVASRINALADPSSRPTIEQLARDPPPSTPIVECFFYHSQNAAHLLEAYEKAGHDGIHQWEGNTVHA
jgi:hypothetical protein